MDDQLITRPPRADEAAALHRLMNDVQRADDLPMLAPQAEVDDLFDSPDIDPTADLRVFELDGELVAYGIVEHSPAGERHERATLLGGVHADWRRRGIGTRMLSWQVERAEQRLAATDARLAAQIDAYAYDFESARIGLLELHGFHQARFDHELIRPLLDLPAPTDIDGITIRGWADDDHEPARLVHNASFADHWGSTPRSQESWRHSLESAGRRLDLSFVAVDDISGEVVAVSLNSHYPDDREVTGRLDGWIDSLGTLRSHRNRGIASALVVRSLHEFEAAGFDHAMLAVDSENPTGAYGIYEGLGFTKRYASVTMQRQVRDAAAPADE